MSRPKKQGMEYFTVDVNFYQDIKIRKLIRYKGVQAVSVYHILLCQIYASGYYLLWDDDIPFTVSEIAHLEEDYVKDVIDYCLSIELFNKTLYEQNNVLSSRGIQQRFFDFCAVAKRRLPDDLPYRLVESKGSSVITEENAVISEETRVISEETDDNAEETPINAGKSAQSKVKESKGENIPPISPQGGMGDSPSGGSDLNDAGAAEEVPAADEVSSNPVGYEKFDLSFVCDELRESFFRWLDYKRVDQRFKYKSVTSIKTCYNSLVKFSRSDPAKAMLIVEQSITNGWKGMFNSNMNNNGTGQQLTAQQRIDAELERGFEYAKGILARNDASIRDGVQPKVW